MKAATNEELTHAVITLSNILAGMLELNAKIAEIVTPLASNLNDDQKRELLNELSQATQIASSLRETTRQFTGQ